MQKEIQPVRSQSFRGLDLTRHKDALITLGGVSAILIMTLVFLYR